MANVFRPRADLWLRQIAAFAVLASVGGTAALYYYGPPEYTRVGYAPLQPTAFSHELHAGQIGMSCLYCHSNVEESPHAMVPPTATCLNCHNQVRANSPLLAEIREAGKTGRAVAWERVHKTPDYVYFNHSVHVKRGVGCVSCHGKVNEMPIIRHDQPLSMGWCLECHRNPEFALRPPSEATNLDWSPPVGQTQVEVGLHIKQQLAVNPPQTCAGCHR